jgi:diguanylate cyclase (GGDEF)-like protein/PAS domain S-box-containing protein
MKLLLVEDNPTDARWVREVLADADAGIEPVHVGRVADALGALATQIFDAVLLDLGLPDSESPEETLRRVIGASAGAAVVVLTGLDDDAAGERAVQGGAQAYLVKGQFDGRFLSRTLRQGAERQRLLARLAREVAIREQVQEALERVNSTLSARVQERTAELEQVNRALSVLSQANRTLLRARDEQMLLDEICRLVADRGGYLLAWVGYARHDADKSVQLVASAGEGTSYLESLRVSWADNDLGRGPTGTAIRTGRTVVERDMTGSMSYLPWRDAAMRSGFQAGIALPLHVEGQVIGMLGIYSQTSSVFESREVDLLEELAADLSFGIEAVRGRAARREAEAKTRLLSNAIEQTADLVTITDSNGAIQYVNAAFERVTGYTLDEVIDRQPSILKSGLQSPDFYERLWRTITSGRPFRGTFINRRKDGGLYYEQKTVTPIIRDERGEITHFLSTGKDITDQVAAEDRLRHLTQYDPITELPNRSVFLDRLGQLLERAETHGQVAAVLVLNLDRFKVINDSLGHEAGDALLWGAGRRLIEAVRPGDTVARLDADSFAILLDDINTVDDVAPLVDKLQAGFAEPFRVKGEELYSTVSMGVSIWPGDGDTAEVLLQNAEVAMSRAKQRGRARCEYYESAMNAHAAKRIALETGLRRALEREEFVLYYQPKVDLRTERIIGVEALIRWQHPEHGLVPPGEFIPLLEETGLIVPLGRWVLETACAQHRAWAAQGWESLVMAVNLSAQQFAQGDLVQVVRDTMASHGCTTSGDWLELEITESAMMQDMAHTATVLRQLKEMGLRIAIDDFGTGHSSLSYLTRLPIDVLKIDRSFVIPLPHSPQDGEVVQAILALARSLSLDVVAEGVETEEQQVFLLDQGCARAQGYYFARPLPAEQIAPLLAALKKPTDEEALREAAVVMSVKSV